MLLIFFHSTDVHDLRLPSHGVLSAASLPDPAGHFFCALRRMLTGITLALKIDLLRFAFKEGHISKKLPDGINNVRQIKSTGRHFVQHGSEQKEVFPVNQSDFDVRSSGESLIEFERRI